MKTCLRIISILEIDADLCVVAVVADCLQPFELQPTRLLWSWDFSAKKYLPEVLPGVSCHCLLHSIFPTQGSNPLLLCLLHWQVDSLPTKRTWVVKNLPADTGDASSIPGLGKSPEGRHGNPFQYSCLENSMDWGAWQATVHGVTKSWTQLSAHTHTHTHTHPTPIACWWFWP